MFGCGWDNANSYQLRAPKHAPWVSEYQTLSKVFDDRAIKLDHPEYNLIRTSHLLWPAEKLYVRKNLGEGSFEQVQNGSLLSFSSKNAFSIKREAGRPFSADTPAKQKAVAPRTEITGQSTSYGFFGPATQLPKLKSLTAKPAVQREPQLKKVYCHHCGLLNVFEI